MHLVDDRRAVPVRKPRAVGNETSGGSAANTCRRRHCFGGTAAFIGTVADDSSARYSRHDLRRPASSTEPPSIPTRHGATGRSHDLVTPDGERTMNTYIGVGIRSRMEHLDPQALDDASITYVEGYLLDDAHPFDAWHEGCMAIVSRAGRKFSVTLSDPFCVDRHRDAISRLARWIHRHLLRQRGRTANAVRGFRHREGIAVDLRTVRDCGDHQRRTRFGDRKRRSACRRFLRSPRAFSTPPALGDLYASGVLTGIAHGLDFETCGRMGSRAASAIVSRMGARLSSSIDPLWFVEDRNQCASCLGGFVCEICS